MLFIVNEENVIDIWDNIQKKIDVIKIQSEGVIDYELLVFIIDGKLLIFVFEKDFEKMFLDFVVMCKVVICCCVLFL